MEPESYLCTENSPINPQWTSTNPSVFWTHIFCGEISTNDGSAHGFHSETPTSNYQTCVEADDCTYNNAGNGYCGSGQVKIFDENDQDFIPKTDISTLFNINRDVNTMINTLVDIYYYCSPPSSYSTLCARGCNYLGNTVQFDILMVLSEEGIKTAYPVDAGTCTSGYICYNQCYDI